MLFRSSSCCNGSSVVIVVNIVGDMDTFKLKATWASVAHVWFLSGFLVAHEHLVRPQFAREKEMRFIMSTFRIRMCCKAKIRNQC